MDELTAGFQPFVAIVERGSISAAARALGVPRATLSRQLASLEDELGVLLAHRSTRRLALTPAGEELYRRARLIVAQAEEARGVVARLDGVPRGLLRVSVPPGPAAQVLAGVLVTYLSRYPEVRVEVTATTRHVDLVAEGIDVALRAGRLDDPSLVARQLRRSDLIAVASPADLAARGTPVSPADLAGHDCLVGYDRGATPARAWPLRGGGTLPISGRLATNDLDLTLAAAEAGLGVALVPDLVAAAALAAGRLVVVLPDHIGISSVMALVYPSREHLDPKVRAFVDLAGEALRGADLTRQAP